MSDTAITSLVANATAICITGATAQVMGAPPSVLDDALSCVATRFETGGPLGHRHGRERVRYWIPAGGRAVTVPAGLVPRLVATLGAAGLCAEVQDRRVHRATADVEHAARLLGAELADRLAHEPRGLVEAAGRDAIDFSAGVAELFPAARVLVPTRNRGQARVAYRRLRWRLGGAVGHWRELDAHTHRVAVTTLPRLSHATPDDFEVVVAPDAWAATRRPARDGLVRLGVGRVYGCVPPGAAPSLCEQLTLEAAFGPMLTAGLVGVSVVMAVPPWSPPVAATGALARKCAVWADAARNRFIADVAVAVTGRDEAALCRLGLVAVLNGLAAVAAPRVAILVESPEHGRLLRRLMPNWPLVTAGMPDIPLPVNVIITLSAAARMKTFDAGVLMRADGAAGPMGVSGFPSKATAGSTAVVIDLADDFDSVARENTAARIDWYERRGWVVGGSRRRDR